jgi:hypothetical protein
MVFLRAVISGCVSLVLTGRRTSSVPLRPLGPLRGRSAFCHPRSRVTDWCGADLVRSRSGAEFFSSS